MSQGGARTTKERRAGQIMPRSAPPEVKQLLGEQRCFESASGCSIILGHEPARLAPQQIWLPPEATLLWHLSIAHQRRYPTWDEIADIRYALVPADVTMAMLLPPPEKYLNVHERCFHLWQIEDRRIDEAHL